MKSIEELNTLKEKVESVNKKLAELTEEELAQVSGCVEPLDGGPVFVRVNYRTKYRSN